MPMYDRRCAQGHLQLDCYEPMEAPVVPCATCGTSTERVHLPGAAPAVIGDEIDVEIKHGLCHEDGTPRRFRSRQDLHRATEAKGLMPYVRHHDGSRFTRRWV